MTKLTETFVKVLENRFPEAKVSYNLDGYWDVTIDADIGTIIESYRLENGKLIHFATLELED